MCIIHQQWMYIFQKVLKNVKRAHVLVTCQPPFQCCQISSMINFQNSSKTKRNTLIPSKAKLNLHRWLQNEMHHMESIDQCCQNSKWSVSLKQTQQPNLDRVLIRSLGWFGLILNQHSMHSWFGCLIFTRLEKRKWGIKRNLFFLTTCTSHNPLSYFTHQIIFNRDVNVVCIVQASIIAIHSTNDTSN